MGRLQNRVEQLTRKVTAQRDWLFAEMCREALRVALDGRGVSDIGACVDVAAGRGWFSWVPPFAFLTTSAVMRESEQHVDSRVREVIEYLEQDYPELMGFAPDEDDG